jgi:predicted RecA/RadA family phage recombinase
MQSYLASADEIAFESAPGAMTVDVPYVYGGRIIIPCDTVSSGEAVTAKTRGLFRLTKVSGAISDSPHTAAEAITAGQRLYWDATNAKVTPKALGLFIGYAAKAAADTATEVRVFVTDTEYDSPAVFRGYLKAPLAIGTTAATMFGADIPSGYIPVLYGVEVHTTFTDGADDSATIALGIVTDDDNCLKTATAVSAVGDFWDAGVRTPALPAAGLKTTAARKFCAVVADDDLTAGALTVFALCVKAVGF